MARKKIKKYSEKNKFSGEWKSLGVFLIKPSLVFVYIIIISYIVGYIFQQNPFAKGYITCIVPVLTLICGILIRYEWDKHKKNTIYKNQAEPAIKALEGLERDLNNRLRHYKTRNASKEDLKLFLREILTRISDAKNSWQTFNINEQDEGLKKLNETKEEEDSYLKKSEKKIDQNEN